MTCLLGASAASVLAFSDHEAGDRRGSPAARYSFRDITRRAGLRVGATPTWGSTFVDRDLDGWPELLLVRHKREAFLFDNDAGQLTRRFAPTFLPPRGRWYYDRHSCAWGEANGDGELDLACVSGAQKGIGTGPNTLYLGPQLVEVGKKAGVQDLYGRGRSIDWLDFDGDGDLDLFVGNQIRPGAPNLTLRNDGGRFVAVDIGVTEERATNDSSWADWDNDGDPDLLILGQGLRGSSAFENRSGRFVEVQMEGVTGQPWRAGLWGDFDGDGWIDLSLVDDNRAVILGNRSGKLRSSSMTRLGAGRASAWIDVENDGDLDLFVVQGMAPGPRPKDLADLLLVNTGGRFEPRETEASSPSNGDGEAASVADVDRDGRADLFVTNGAGEAHRGRPYLWRNESRAAASISLSLYAGPWNPYGSGATIEVAAGGRSWLRQVTDGVGGHVQSGPAQIFGIGTNAAAVVKVTWPSGGSDCRSISAGDFEVVRRGRSPCSPIGSVSGPTARSGG